MRHNLSLLGLTLLAACSSSPSGNTPPPPPPAAVATVTLNVSNGQVAEGGTIALVATPREAGGAAITGKTVSWSTANAAVATVSSSGVVTGVTAGGPVNITATSEGKTASAAITVTPTPVNVVTVSPATASIQVGSTTNLVATPKSANGVTLTGRAVAWSTSAPAVATVNNGVVTAVTAGSATITASSEGKSGTAVITVTAPPSALFTPSNELRITNVPAEVGFWGTAVAPNGEAVSYANTKVYSRSAAGVWTPGGVDIPGTPAVVSAHADPNGGFWATGSNGVIVRRVGSNWVPEATGTSAAAFNAIAIRADGSGIAVGNPGGTVYHRNSAGAWTPVSAPVPGGTVLNGVGSPTDNFALATGNGISGNGLGFGMRWDGSAWTAVTYPVANFAPAELIVVSPTEAYTIGMAGTNLLAARYTILQWNGAGWQVLFQRPVEVYPYPAGIARCPNGTIYFGYKYGTIYRKPAGGALSVMTNNHEIAGNGFDLACDPDNSLLLTADEGFVARHNGSWTIERWLPNLTGVAMGSATSTFVTSGTTVARNMGAGWIRTPIALSNGAPVIVPRTIWANGNEAIVTGQPHGRFSGGNWTWGASSLSIGRQKAWGSSATAVFTVGDFRHVDMWNGATWSEVANLFADLTIYDEIDGAGSFAMALDRGRKVGATWNGTTWSVLASPPPVTLQRIKVFGPTSVIGVTTTKTYLWNGTAWAEIANSGPGGSADVVAMVGRNVNDLYAFTGSNIYHFNGTAWTVVGSTGGTVTDAALFGNQVMAVGSGGLVLRATLP